MAREEALFREKTRWVLNSASTMRGIVASKVVRRWPIGDTESARSLTEKLITRTHLSRSSSLSFPTHSDAAHAFALVLELVGLALPVEALVEVDLLDGTP